MRFLLPKGLAALKVISIVFNFHKKSLKLSVEFYLYL